MRTIAQLKYFVSLKIIGLDVSYYKTERIQTKLKIGTEKNNNKQKINLLWLLLFPLW